MPVSPQQEVSSTSAVAAANLGVKFLLELAALALLGYWGAVAGAGFGAVALAVAAPAVMIAIWARFAAPKAAHRLPPRSRIPLELGLFALAAVAGYAAGAAVLAIAFAVVAAVNAVALTVLNQWEA